jgi:hypothetical protein
MTTSAGLCLSVLRIVCAMTVRSLHLPSGRFCFDAAIVAAVDHLIQLQRPLISQSSRGLPTVPHLRSTENTQAASLRRLKHQAEAPDKDSHLESLESGMHRTRVVIPFRRPDLWCRENFTPITNSAI